MKIKLKKPIKSSDNTSIKELNFDFESLTIKDMEKIERTYFALTEHLGENILYKGTKTYCRLCFFEACNKNNNKLKFSDFLKIEGGDADKILELSEHFLFAAPLIEKKKD